jgi:hypothetical protein
MSETRGVLRCVYADLDATLLGPAGSFLYDTAGRFTLLGARALEACDRAGVEAVVWSERDRAELDPVAELLGLQAWIAADVLVLDGEELETGGLAAAVERHLRARACAPADALAVAADLALAGVVGTLWLAGPALEDPLLRLELDARADVRMAEEAGVPALYEAVVTTLAESGRSSSA